MVAYFRLVLLLVMMSATAQLLAYGETEESTSEFYYEPEKEQLWRDQEVRIPDSPRQDTLLEVPIQHPAFQFWIDTESLYVDEKDPLVRYIIVLVSKSGVRNMRYEAIHCVEREYRTYAYGVGEGPLQRARSADWKPVGAGEAYRDELQRHYLCGAREKLNKKDILQRIRYPVNIYYD